jgi:hypothetical protein
MFGALQLRRIALVVVGLAVVGGTTLTALPAQAASSAVTCGTKVITKELAPGVGKTYVADAPTAGTVTLLQSATANLEVQSAAPTSGWKDVVKTPSGASVRVSFSQILPGVDQVRFVARVDTTGKHLTISTVTCS